jgi:hypothetical protein
MMGVNMSTEPNPEPLEHFNAKSIERFVRHLDYALTGKYGAPNVQEEFIRALREHKQQQLQDPSLLFHPYPNKARRRLTPLYAYRYIRDAIKLRRYNDSLR